MLYVKNGRVLTMAGKIFENGQVVIEMERSKQWEKSSPARILKR